MIFRNLCFGIVILCITSKHYETSKEQPSVAKKRLQSTYNQMALCWKKSDIDGFMKPYRFDFKRKMPGGKVRSLASERTAYKQALLSHSPTQRVSINVLNVKIKKDTIVANIGIWWYHKNGILYQKDTDIWVKTRDGWKIKASANSVGDKFSRTVHLKVAPPSSKR